MPQGTEEIKNHYKDLNLVKREIAKAVVGQDRIIEGLLKALMVNGHVIIEGVPGVAKTLIIKSLAATTGCNFKRIQFTVDLLPGDITGVLVYEKEKGFYVLKGPIFANFVLADEINRASSKTQSAMLEAMQEKQVTIARKTFPLSKPFFVMATQNPIEHMGVYELPEAQLDRFLFKLKINYPLMEQEKRIIDQNADIKPFEEYDIQPILSPEKIIMLQKLTKQVFLSENLKDYIIRLVDATRNPKKYGIDSGKYLEFGASPRATINLALASKAEAILRGVGYVTDNHIKSVAHDILRHRLVMTYEGLAAKIKPEEVIDEVLSRVEVIS